MTGKARNHIGIKEWAEQDRPREKLLQKGRSSLTDAELIGILIGSGTSKLTAVELSKQILASVNHDLNQLGHLTIKDLQEFRGIGEAKAIAIISALELGRRRSSTSATEKPKVSSPSEAYELMKPELLDLKKEEFWIILLNRANTLIKKIHISSGGVSGTTVDPKLIYKHAVENLASGIILVHNHPSGNLSPSNSDHQITTKLAKAGEFLELPIIDHIIFGDEGFLSFKDEGLL